MARVDYDQIAHLYDEPLREHAVDPRLLAFLEERPDLGSGPVVVDTGICLLTISGDKPRLLHRRQRG
jgi:hypothetical protein